MRRIVTTFLLALALGAPALAEDLSEGMAAPDFRATDDEGRSWSLSGLKGRYVVLFFYPKDDTPGCTTEAVGFQGDSKAFAERDAVVLGASADDAKSHQKFREKHGLEFPLLTGGKDLAQAFGVPVRLGFTARQTFVIGPDGRLVKVYRKVSPEGHSQEVLAAIDAHRTGPAGKAE